MAAEVSRQIKNEGKPITRDFLGGCLAIESKELDLDLQVPSGWEKRLDLQSGKVYIQRCAQPSSPSSHKKPSPTNQTQPYSSKMQDLNFPPQPKTTLSLFDDTALDLKLFPNSPSKTLTNYNSATYQSVCTLDKVKSALDRAWRVSSPTSSSSKKRPSPSNSGSSSMATADSNSNSNSYCRDPITGLVNGGEKMVAGACPGLPFQQKLTKLKAREESNAKVGDSNSPISEKMSVSVIFSTRIPAMPSSLGRRTSVYAAPKSVATIGGGGMGLMIECSSRPQKKATAHHRKTRPRKSQPWDIRRGPAVYPPLPPLPADWTVVGTASEAEVDVEAADATSPPPENE